jgi:hypothetical protein
MFKGQRTMQRTLNDRTWPTATTWIVLIASFFPWAPLSADVTIQQETTIHASIVKAHGTNIDRIAGDKQRNETQFACDGMLSIFCGHIKTVDIVRLDRGVKWKVEPKQKRYTESAIPTPEQHRAELAHQQAVMDKLKSCPQPAHSTFDTSKCDMSPPVFAVSKTLDETSIIGHQARRTNVSMTQSCKIKDSADVCSMSYSFDVWLTQDELPGLGDRANFASAYRQKIGESGGEIANVTELNPMLAPYADSLRQLSARSADFKGYPLKTTFRLAVGGAHCGLIPGATAPQSGGDNTLANAGGAAERAGASSTQTAAGWGASEAVQKASGSSLGGYVAGSAAGAFTQSLVGGLFAKKKKADSAQSGVPPSGASTQAAAGEPLTTVAEISVETIAIDPAPIAADQFEVPPGLKKFDPRPADSDALPSCPTT